MSGSARVGPWHRFTSKLTQLDYFLHMFLRARRNVAIPVDDGVNMRADIFTPIGFGPWPVIVSAYPYQKDSLGAVFSLEAYYLLKAGYAIVLADLPGTGASDGVSRDAFDCLRPGYLRSFVEWSAGQKWCNGKVGIAGMSYGGIAALRTAAENPPSLKAVYASMAPISFYDDVAYPGGSLSMLSVLGAWLNLMNLLNLFPPLYVKNRPDWTMAWQARLDGFVPYLAAAADNVTYDNSWKEIEIPIENIKAPTFVVDGWYGFSHRNSFQTYRRLSVARKMVVGPWVHIWPTSAAVEPRNHVFDMLRWFDHWLKDKDNGITEEPPLSIFVMGGDFWKHEHEWLPLRGQEMDFHLRGDRSLRAEAEATASSLTYAHDAGVGTTAGLMSLFSLGIDYPKDQATDDLRSLTFDTAPLAGAMEIAGEPLLSLSLSTDMPDAAITARLCDVDADGNSTLVTRGWRRMSRREGLDHSVPPDPEGECHMSIRLWPTDYQIKAGHRLRLCLALSDFPHIFPLPYNGSIRLMFGPTHLQKLTLCTLSEDAPRNAAKLRPPNLSLFQGFGPSGTTWQVTRDKVANTVGVNVGTGAHVPRPYLSAPFELKHVFSASLTESKPATATLDATATATFGLAGHRYAFEARQVVTFDRADISVKAEEDGKPVMEKTLTKELRWV